MADRTEDQRTAATLVTTLSGLVMTATLAVLGAQAVIVTFVVDRRENLDWFYGVSAAAVIALVASIIIGGKSIYEIIELGAGGEWRIRTRRHKFELQSAFALLGAVLVVVSAFLGDPKAAGHSHDWRRDDGRHAESVALYGARPLRTAEFTGFNL